MRKFFMKEPPLRKERQQTIPATARPSGRMQRMPQTVPFSGSCVRHSLKKVKIMKAKL